MNFKRIIGRIYFIQAERARFARFRLAGQCDDWLRRFASGCDAARRNSSLRSRRLLMYSLCTKFHQCLFMFNNHKICKKKKKFGPNFFPKIADFWRPVMHNTYMYMFSNNKFCKKKKNFGPQFFRKKRRFLGTRPRTKKITVPCKSAP